MRTWLWRLRAIVLQQLWQPIQQLLQDAHHLGKPLYVVAGRLMLCSLSAVLMHVRHQVSTVHHTLVSCRRDAYLRPEAWAAPEA